MADKKVTMTKGTVTKKVPERLEKDYAKNGWVKVQDFPFDFNSNYNAVKK